MEWLFIYPSIQKSSTYLFPPPCFLNCHEYKCMRLKINISLYINDLAKKRQYSCCFRLSTLYIFFWKQIPLSLVWRNIYLRLDTKCATELDNDIPLISNSYWVLFSSTLLSFGFLRWIRFPCLFLRFHFFYSLVGMKIIVAIGDASLYIFVLEYNRDTNIQKVCFCVCLNLILFGILKWRNDKNNKHTCLHAKYTLGTCILSQKASQHAAAVSLDGSIPEQSFFWKVLMQQK